MITIERSRSGSLTQITVTVGAADLVESVCAALRTSSRFTSMPGLVQSVACNRREAEAIEQRLAILQRSLQARAAQTAPVQPAAAQRESTWAERVLYRDGSAVVPAATITTRDGEILRFTGFGRSFVCRDELADPQLRGQSVRYAYYA